MQLFARLDQDGNATTIDAGDWVGETTMAITPGNTEVRLQLEPVGAPQAWQATVTISAPEPPPAGAVTFVLLRAQNGRIPLAALKTELTSYPHTVTLDESHLLSDQPPAFAGHEIIVKVDSDGDPQSTSAGDWFGAADAGADIQIQLQPDTRGD